MAECKFESNDGYNGVELELLKFLISKGFNATQACAICGNASVECGRFKDYAKEVSDSGGVSYGLFQWHNGNGSDRYTKLKNFCKSNNLDYSTVKGQLAYLWYELNTPYYKSKVLDPMMTTRRNDGLEEAVSFWEKNFEGCSICHHSDRVAEAKKARKLIKEDSGADCVVNDTGGSSSGSSDPCDDYTSVQFEESSSNAPSTSAQENTTQTSNKTNGLNTKPVLFGGTWAYMMSKYMGENDEYLLYTVWNGQPMGENRRDNSWPYYMGGLKDNGWTSTNSKAIITYVKIYFAKKVNRPVHIVIVIDMHSMWLTRKPSASDSQAEVVNDITRQLTEFFKLVQGYCTMNQGKNRRTQIIVPLLVDSYENDFVIGRWRFTYQDINSAIKKAANKFPEITPIVVPGINKGTKPVDGGGIMADSAWKLYSDKIKEYCRRIK